MLKRNGLIGCLICFLLFSLTACAEEKPLETTVTTATTTTETTTQTMLLTTEGAAVTTTETTLPVTEGIEVTTTTETSTTTERTTFPEEWRTTVICSLPTTILCTVTTTEVPYATTTRLTGPDTVVTAPQTSWDPSTTTTTTSTIATVRTTGTTEATYPEPHGQQLEILLNGKTVRLTFSKTAYYNRTPTRYRTLHVYEGVLSNGTTVICKVVPLVNRIHSITYNAPLEVGVVKKEDAQAFVLAELERMGFKDLQGEKLNLSVINNKGMLGNFLVFFDIEVAPCETLFGGAQLVDRKLVLTNLRTQHTIRRYSEQSNGTTDWGESEPYFTEYASSYLIPNWV